MKKIFLYIFFLGISLSLYAQRDSLTVHKDTQNIHVKKFDKNRLDSYKNNTDFNYKTLKKEPTIIERLIDWIKRIIRKLLSFIFNDISPAVGILWSILRIIPYLLTGIVFFLMVKFFLKVNIKKLLKKPVNKAITQISDDEILIKSNQLPDLITQAISNNNYRLATRYLYLQLLQKLTEKEFIVWQKDKTNEDYINEIKKEKLRNEIEKLTYLYDFVWYGKFNIKQKDFTKAQQNFINVYKIIN